MFIKSFTKLSGKDRAIAGGKGASLGELTQHEIPVPPGFVALSSAFDTFIEENELGPKIEAILSGIDRKATESSEYASNEIQELILNANIPKRIENEIRIGFKKLNSVYVAVRSSATAEDSSSTAWAGQLDTFLNTVEKNLLKNVQKCWASLFSPRAIFYRFENGLQNQKVSVAVVIQKMIASEKSGVAFSVHPITQDKNELVIEAGIGLGEAIVSGSITPDNYVVSKIPVKILQKTLNIQTKALIRSGKDGNEWVTLTNGSEEKSVLNDDQILELAALITKIENHYQSPQDVEWAFEKGKFYITQSRPITTLEGF